MPRDTDLTNVQNIQDKLAIFLNIQYGLNSYTRVSEKINGFMNDVSKNGYDIGSLPIKLNKPLLLI